VEVVLVEVEEVVVVEVVEEVVWALGIRWKMEEVVCNDKLAFINININININIITMLLLKY